MIVNKLQGGIKMMKTIESQQRQNGNLLYYVSSFCSWFENSVIMVTYFMRTDTKRRHVMILISQFY